MTYYKTTLRVIDETGEPQGGVWNMAADEAILQGKVLANPRLHSVVGKNDYDQKDGHGKYFVREMIDLIKSKGFGWIYYHMKNQETGRLAPKKGYIHRIGKTNYYILIPTLMN